MMYRVYFTDGSEELVQAASIQDAKDACEDYGTEISKVIALGETDDEEDDLDDDDFGENLDDDDFGENPDDEEDE